MWLYERRLQYPVNIRHPDKELANYIIECLNASPYETKASCQYISQRYRSHYREINGLLTDIGTEAVIITTEKYHCKIQIRPYFLKNNLYSLSI